MNPAALILIAEITTRTIIAIHALAAEFGGNASQIHDSFTFEIPKDRTEEFNTKMDALMLQYKADIDDLLMPEFNVVGTQTGRISSLEPNFSNPPTVLGRYNGQPMPHQMVDLYEQRRREQAEAQQDGKL